MRPTPFSCFFLIIAVPAFLYAWLMNSPKAAALGFALLAFLFLQGGVFLARSRTAALSAVITRTTDVSILTQGGLVSVSAEVTAPQTPLTVEWTDVPPAGAAVTAGSTSFVHGKASYTIRLPVMGTSGFGGVRMRVSDLFFSTDMLISYARGPELVVYPTGISLTFSSSGYAATESTDERDRLAIIPGADIRNYRPYADGDNIKNINWKMSARYDELYVQLKTDATGDNPMLVLDLPSDGTASEVAAEFTDAASGVIERLKRREAYPVFIYSGADCLGMGSSDKEDEMYAYMSLAGTVKRETALFRHRHISSLLKEANLMPAGYDLFTTRIHDLLRQSGDRYPTTFEKNYTRISAENAGVSHLYIVSCARGDVSNLLFLIADAQLYQRKVIVVLAGLRNTPRESEIVSLLFDAGAFDVEVVS